MTKSGDDSRLLTRGMNVISAIGLADGAVSFAYIQRKTELPKATLSRILSTLRTNEFVTFDASGKRYSLGSKLIDLFNFNKAVVFARQASKNEMDVGFVH